MSNYGEIYMNLFYYSLAAMHNSTLSHFVDNVVFESHTVFPPGEVCVRNGGPCYGGADNNDCVTGSDDCRCDIKDQVSCYVNEGTINQ